MAALTAPCEVGPLISNASHVDAISLFKKRFEEQAGVVHLAQSTVKAAEVAVRAVRIQGAKLVALGAMPQPLGDELQACLRKSGIDCVDYKVSGQVGKVVSSTDAGFTHAAFGVAETNAIVEVTEDDSERLISSLPRIHVAFLRKEDIILRLDDASERLKNLFRLSKGNFTVTFISGPSRTADIELKLILGVHGPHEVHVVVYGGG